MYKVTSDAKVKTFDELLAAVLKDVGRWTLAPYRDSKARQRMRSIHGRLIELSDLWNEVVEWWPGDE